MSDKLKDSIAWMKSAKGITILSSLLLALYATINSGPYVLVNTIITGGMLALVSTGLTLMLGVLNIAMFAHGEFFMIGSLAAYYVFTPISNYTTLHPDSLLVIWGPLVAIFRIHGGGRHCRYHIRISGVPTFEKTGRRQLGDELLFAHRGLECSSGEPSSAHLWC